MITKIIEELSREYLIAAKRREPIYLYHGSMVKNLGSILSSGLLANPKERAWGEDPYASYHSKSRESLGGIYLTDNLLTAYSAVSNAASISKNKGKEKLIIMVEVIPTSLYMDEDDLGSFEVPGISNHEWTILMNYAEYKKTGKVNEEDLERYKERIKKYYIDYKLSGNANKGLEDRLWEIIEEVYIRAMERKVAYIESGEFKRAMRGEGLDVEQPGKGEAERRYKEAEDKLTRIMKSVREFDGRYTGRVVNDIGYNRSGHRIVAIFRLDGMEKVSLEYPKSIGDVPAGALEKFKEDYRKAIGGKVVLAGLGERAREHYGITEDPGKAGYILPNGEMLDFSEGGVGRNQDHRNVNYLLKKEFESRSDGMEHFMKVSGAIRYVPESGGFDIRKRPTVEQKRKVMELGEMYNEVRVDMKRGGREFSKRYDSWELSDMIIDIEEFWR